MAPPAIPERERGRYIMNNKIRQAFERAMNTMAVLDSSEWPVWEEDMSEADRLKQLANFHVRMAEEWERVGKTFTWVKHQLRQVESYLMTQPLPTARGTSNSLSSLGELLPTGVIEARSELARASKLARDAYASHDLHWSWATAEGQKLLDIQ